jgi:hypothetical protein
MEVSTLETLQKLKSEIEMDCLAYDSDNYVLQNPENYAVFNCVIVIDKYIEQAKENQQ